MTEDFLELQEKLQRFSSENIAVHVLPSRTVGVQGDGRTYSYLVGLSGGNDSSGTIDWDALFVLAKEIPKYAHQVNRVVYVFGEKIQRLPNEITPTFLTQDVVEQLRNADLIVNNILIKYDLTRSLTQVPVVLFPVTFGKHGQRAIAIRTFITNDFMTGVPARPGKEMPISALKEMADRILQEVRGISRVVYDLTAKPPGTTEWE
jgi:GMP synthase (glutamine-hydrolysing)